MKNADSPNPRKKSKRVAFGSHETDAIMAEVKVDNEEEQEKEALINDTTDKCKWSPFQLEAFNEYTTWSAASEEKIENEGWTTSVTLGSFAAWAPFADFVNKMPRKDKYSIKKSSMKTVIQMICFGDIHLDRVTLAAKNGT